MTATAGRMPYGSVTSQRLELARRAAELRDAGLTHRQIAQRLGISRSYANELLLDPDGSKARARKDGYRQPCPECGRPMGGGDGPAGTPERCESCARQKLSDERFWTPDRIVEHFRRFHELAGRPPSTTDAMIRLPSIRAKCSTERIAEGERMLNQAPLPQPGLVSDLFGSWGKALAAAGLPAASTGGAAHRGRRGPGLTGSQDETLSILRAGPATVREVAAARRITERAARACLHVLARRGLVAAPDRRGGAWSLTGTDVISRRRPAVRSWVVLRQRDEGVWEEIRVAEAPSDAVAIEALASDAGLYVAVPEHAWSPLPVAPVTRLSVIRELERP